MSVFRFLAVALLLLLAIPARAEDGYDLWLRYRPIEAAAQAQYRPLATAIVSEGNSPSLDETFATRKAQPWRQPPGALCPGAAPDLGRESSK